MVRIEVDASAALSGLNRFKRDMPQRIESGLDEAAEELRSKAIQYAPRGPTKSEAKAAGVGYSAKKAPGTLQNSISTKKGKMYRDVGVLSGAARQYAHRVHELKPNQRGPGTKRKGPKAGPKYLERALKDSEKDIASIIDKAAGKAVTKFNRR